MTEPPSLSRRARVLAAMAAVSLALHAGGLALAARLEPRPAARPPPLEVDFEAVPPPPPPAKAAPAPPAEPPAPRRVAVSRLPPAPEQPPPPPNEPAPPDAPKARPVPRVGVSLSSTATAGAFAVGVGNTLHGKAAEVADDPREVKPYAADGTAPPVRSARPRLLEQPVIPYPPEARRAGLEGQVVMLLRIDAQGRVAAARVIAEPGSGSGLGAAARAAALRFRFTPALLEGEPIETEIRFTYTFVLE